ncbi:MAG: hypothetical protein K2M11_01965 [Paramuribaculum sp.]|nr:hypothetical protein [Paramuribaculum sp.]
MKLFKIFSVAAILAVSALSSCSDKGYMDEAPLEQGLTFQCATYNETLAPGAAEIVIPVRRTIASGEETVNIKFTPGKNCPTDITVPSQVKFEAGSNTAEIVINISNATPPATYAGTLEFDGTPSYAGISTLTLNCPVNYTWVSLGKGTYYDMFVMRGADDPYPVEILKAEGFERYRAVNPYVEYYNTLGKENYPNSTMSVTSNGPAYVEFWENASGTLSFNSFATGLYYKDSGGNEGAIGAYSWTAFNASAGYTGDDDIWYEPGFAVLAPVYYINGVGGFGQIQYGIQIELP